MELRVSTLASAHTHTTHTQPTRTQNRQHLMLHIEFVLPSLDFVTDVAALWEQLPPPISAFFLSEWVVRKTQTEHL